MQQMLCKLEPFTITVELNDSDDDDDDDNNNKETSEISKQLAWHLTVHSIVCSHNYVIHVIDNDIKIRL